MIQSYGMCHFWLRSVLTCSVLYQSLKFILFLVSAAFSLLEEGGRGKQKRKRKRENALFFLILIKHSEREN